MTNLPININSAPVKATASKQSGNVDATQQDAQGFGNVLSRKVADSAKPAGLSPPTPVSSQTPGAPQTPSSSQTSSAPQTPVPARSSTDGTQQASEQGNTEAATIEEVGDALPADMLATLLAQQNLPATAQPDSATHTDSNTQPDNGTQAGINALPVVNVQPGFSTQAAPIVQTSTSSSTAPGKDTNAALTLVSANGQTANSSAPVLETAIPQISNSAQASSSFAEAFKALGMKETAATATNPSLRTSVAGDLPVATPQNLALPLAPAATTASSPTSISTALNQPAWGDEFSQKITWMATQRNQNAELHLNPPQLGPLDVVLKMNGDQATAIFTSPHAEVRDAIEQALPKLREMLADSGIMLGNAMVSDQTAKNNQDNSSPKAGARMATSPADDVNEGAGVQEIHVSSRSRHNGMVDTFA